MSAELHEEAVLIALRWWRILLRARWASNVSVERAYMRRAAPHEVEDVLRELRAPILGALTAPHGERLDLYIDYEPQGELADAFRRAGFTVGCMQTCRRGRSVRNLYLPQKTGMMIHPNIIETKDGCGGAWVRLWQKEGAE